MRHLLDLHSAKDGNVLGAGSYAVQDEKLAVSWVAALPVVAGRWRQRAGRLCILAQ